MLHAVQFNRLTDGPKREIHAAKVRESLDTMRDQLLRAGATIIRNLKRRAELMPEDKPLDDRTASDPASQARR